MNASNIGFLPANEKVKYIVLNWITQILATTILWCVIPVELHPDLHTAAS